MLAVFAAAGLAGCSGLVTSGEDPAGAVDTPTDGPPTETAQRTATPEPATPTETPASIETRAPSGPEEGIEVVGTRHRVRADDGYTRVDAEVTLRNTGSYTYRWLEVRIDVIYTDPVGGEETRVVSGYAERRFDDGFASGTADLATNLRARRDGRANRSTNDADFHLELALRRVETVG
ncbi:hypothetical protein GCM10027435_14050 [Haloparvum alkalitolerans]